MYDLDLLDDCVTAELGIERRDVDPHEHLVTAALLAATAFRLKDAEGLVVALRQLVHAVGSFTGDAQRV